MSSSTYAELEATAVAAHDDTPNTDSAGFGVVGGLGTAQDLSHALQGDDTGARQTPAGGGRHESKGGALYRLRLVNQTNDMLYVGDTGKALAEVPDATAFVVPGQTYFTADYTYQTQSKSGVVQAAGSVFYVLRFSASDGKAAVGASTIKDLLVMAGSAVSVIYGGELKYTSGPMQATQQEYTDGPTTVTTDTLDGYMVEAYVTDTTRATPSTALIVAAIVLALVIAAACLGTFHLHHEMRIEHKAIDLVEPPAVAAQLRGK